MTILFSNNAKTTLASSINDTAQTLTVAAGKGTLFPVVDGAANPNGDYFVITLQDASNNIERIKVPHHLTASDVLGSGTYPLVRGFDGTTARSWVTGDVVALRWGKHEAEASVKTRTGGTLDGAPIGQTTPSTAVFTKLTAASSGNDVAATLTGSGTGAGAVITGGASANGARLIGGATLGYGAMGECQVATYGGVIGFSQNQNYYCILGSNNQYGAQGIAAAAGGGSALLGNTLHAGFSGSVISAIAQNKSNDAGYYLFAGVDSGGGNKFLVRGDGNVYYDGSLNTPAADYAEFFEWEDGNPSGQDRSGQSVVLVGEKIRLSRGSDPASSIIGVVSVSPTMLGNNPQRWPQAHIKDDLGRTQKESATMVSWKMPGSAEVRSYWDDEIPQGVAVPPEADRYTIPREKRNPAWDRTIPYVPRGERKEWGMIGLLGRMALRKGEKTGDRWVKLKDISPQIEEWLVR